MRAWILKGQTQMVAALFACCWLVPQVADCQESVLSNVRTSSIPVSNIPLPIAVSIPAQKPTSALFSDREILVTAWQISPKILSAGTQKSVQTKSVSANDITAPERRELPPCETQIVKVSVNSSQNAGSDPSSRNTLPVQQEMVRVQWNIDSESDYLQSDNPQIVNRTADPAQADDCPFVDWNSNKIVGSSQELSIEFCSEVVDGEISPGKAQLASCEIGDSRDQNRESVAELRSLLPMPEPEPEVTYMGELNQLLQGSSNWLFANEQLLDLSPEEGTTAAVSYLDDLNALVGIEAVGSPDAHHAHRHITATAQQGQSENAQSSVAPTPNTSARPYTSIAPDQRCNGVEGVGISALFQSMSSIRVNGLSTAPPVQPRQSATLTAQLERPVDVACQYMDPFSPAYYSTPPRFGAHRPSRDTHVLMHQPLYFEDANLERCGQTSGCLTTACSSVHFATSIAFVPFHMAVEHPHSCVPSLPDCPTCHSFE